MALKLGKFELVDVEVRSSVIEARKLFLELVGKSKPEVSSDLMRLYNVESIPNGQDANNSYAKLFLLHTKIHHFYQLDLTKSGIKDNVRNTPILAFFDFLFKNKTEIEELIEKNEPIWKGYTPEPSQNLVIASAIDEFVPDWKTLKSKGNSNWICRELSLWSEKWNLKDDWCLDFALGCLKDFKSGFIDKLYFPENTEENYDYVLENTYGYNELYDLESYWKHGRAWLSSLHNTNEQRLKDYIFVSKIPNYPTFEYDWKMRTDKGLETLFTVEATYNGLVHSPEIIRQQIEKDFWNKFFSYFSNHRYSFVGNKSLLTNELRKFESKINLYIKKVDKLLKSLESEVTEIQQKRSGEKHSQWLVDYQVIGKSYNQLTQETGHDRRAVTDGIKSVAKIIGLTLRKYEPTGRRKAAKDKADRQERR